jgi:CheY-like chemotaxis protein
MAPKPVILVVDDDAPIILLMRSLLREYGFDPLTAMTGLEAIENVRAQRPDLILLDRNMPGMSGDEVIRALRGEPGLADVPILILSGEPVDPDDLRRLGANAAVLKPFDVAELVEKIRGHLGVRA